MLLYCLRCTLRPSASAITISKLYQHFRERDLPYGLQDSLPTLSLDCSLPCSGNSALDPRLDTGGWLTLTEAVSSFFPTGTFTLQDTPSFARRDNDRIQGLAILQQPTWINQESRIQGLASGNRAARQSLAMHCYVIIVC